MTAPLARASHMPPPPVHVFVPYAAAGEALISPYFETTEMRFDVAQWMQALGRQWQWVRVTARNIEAVVDDARRAGASVFNLCDGDDVNGYPGLSVVLALEAARLAFTGARRRFYEISTSKLAMKERFRSAGVATAPYVVINDVARDLQIAAREIGFPLFLKPDVSFGAAGITLRSLARTLDEAQANATLLLAGMHDCHVAPGGFFAEPYLDGREFTVLCVADIDAPHGVRVLEPGERVFHPALPEDQRFLTFERVCGDYSHDERLPDGIDLYGYAPAPASDHAHLVDLARRAYLAVDGSGYARVDIRASRRTGEAYVLEVNANCALSSDDTSSVGGILAMSGMSSADLIALILADGEARAL